MDANQALEIINGNATLNTDGTIEPKVDNEAKTHESDKTSAPAEENKQGEMGDASSTPEKSDEKVDNEKENASKKENVVSKKKYTRQEKQKHAFKLQRDKLKASQSRIKELEDKLAKYDGLTKDKFESDDKYIDYKVDMTSDKRELEHLKNEQVAQQMEYAKNISEQRIKSNFSDKQEEQEYRKLLDVATNNFRSLHPEYGIDNFADFISEDRTVLEYLADSDNAPRLIRHFIAKPESLLKIMRLSSPLNKHAALNKMENAMISYYRTKDLKVKKPLPSTGRVVNNKITNTNTNAWDKKWTAQDALRYLKNK